MLHYPLHKKKCPRNGSGDNFFERRFSVCSQRIGFVFKRTFGSWFFKGTMDLVFLSDFWTLVFQRDVDLVFLRTFGLGFSKGRGSGFSFGLWTFGSFNTGIRFGFSFGRWTGFYFTDIGLVFSFRTLETLISFV